MLSDAGLAVRGGVSWTARVYRFTFQALVATVIGLTVIGLLTHESRFVTEARLDHPLVAAFDAAQVSIHSAELTVWSPIAVPRSDSAPSMAELKAWAQDVAGRDAQAAEFWSVAEPTHRVVYFQGAESRGGAWTASARVMEDGTGSGGVVEIAYKRALLGRLEDARGALRSAKRRLERAAGQPLPQAVSGFRVEGRPPVGQEAKDLAAALIAAVGGTLRYLGVDGETAVAMGYTPRLVGGVDKANAGRVNVEVRVSPRGRELWVEMGWPQL